MFINLLLVALVLFLALFAVKISNIYGVPSLLLFMFLGISFSFFGLEFSDYQLSNDISSVILMVIMFYGGFDTNWSMGKKVWKESLLLSSFGVIFTAIITGFFCYFILKIPLLESMLLASVVASTDFASVSSILVSKNLNFRYNTAPLLELESGSNDPTAYTMTIVFISLIKGIKVSIGALIFKQISLGIFFGFAFGFLVKKLLEKIDFNKDGLFTVFIATTMIMAYSLTNMLSGNGYLAVYIYGIYLGNQEFIGKRDLVFFFDGLGSILQIGLFFLLGILCDIDKLIAAFPIALIIMIFMTIIARPLTVYGLMKPFKLKKNQLAIISISGLRGAAAIAFAILVINSGVNLSIDIFHIVFVICLLSSAIQGTLMPYLSRKLDMLDPKDSVLKSFNYYQDKSDFGFIQTVIKEGSKLDGAKLRDFNLTFNLIVAKIERDGETIIPKGDTIIKGNDILVLGGQSYFDKKGSKLLEFKLTENHPWTNKYIKDIDLDKKFLIVMVKNDKNELKEAIGDTKLRNGDRIVVLENTEKIEENKKQGK